MNEFFEEDDAAIGKVYDRQLGARLLSYLKPYRRLVPITQDATGQPQHGRPDPLDVGDEVRTPINRQLLHQVST